MRLRRTPVSFPRSFGFPIDGDPDILSPPKRLEVSSGPTDLMIWKGLNRESRVGGPFEGPEGDISVHDPWNLYPARLPSHQLWGYSEGRRARELDRPREQLPTKLELQRPDHDKQPERRPATGEMDVPRAVGPARSILHGRRGDGDSLDLPGSRLQRDELAPCLRLEPGERERGVVCRPSFDGQLLPVSAALGPRSSGRPARPLPCHLPDDGALERGSHLVGLKHLPGLRPEGDHGRHRPELQPVHRRPPDGD